MNIAPTASIHYGSFPFLDYRDGAPWVPTSMGMVRKMLDLAEVGPEDLVCDLGCGDGRTIFTAARRYGARAVGIEIDLLHFLWCQLLVTIYKLGGQIKIIYDDFFSRVLLKLPWLPVIFFRILTRDLRPN